MKNSYSDKKNEYFESTRTEIQNFLPIKIKRLFDVGFGGGMVSWTTKQRLGIEYVAGIEVFEEAAKKAGARLDIILVGD